MLFAFCHTLVKQAPFFTCKSERHLSQKKYDIFKLNESLPEMQTIKGEEKGKKIVIPSAL